MKIRSRIPKLSILGLVIWGFLSAGMPVQGASEVVQDSLDQAPRITSVVQEIGEVHFVESETIRISSLVHEIAEVKIVDEIEEEEIQKEEINEAATEEVSYISYTADELRYMSAIIFCEAGNQCMAGKEAVGIVVMNRSDSPDFANGIYNVISQKGQFTPYGSGSFNRALGMYDRGEIPESCIDAAKYALEGYKTVYYNDKTINMSDYLFFSRYVANARLIIQDHMFK